MLRVISELRPAWVVGENVAGIVNMALDTVLSDLESLGYAVQALIIPACSVDAPHRRDRCAIVAWDSNSGIKRENGTIWEGADAKCSGVCADVSHAESIGLQREWSGGDQIGGARPEKAQPERRCDVLSDTDNRGRSLWRDGELPTVEETGGNGTDHRGRAEEYVTGKRWTTQPGLGGVASRISDWMDRGMSVSGNWMLEPEGVPRITKKREHRSDRLKCLGNAVVPQQFYPIFQAIADIERGI